MAEEKNGANNGTPNTEMAPQEEGTKVPLTGDVKESTDAKIKYSPDGDTKINVGNSPTFTGLTKDQLMEYSKDPFWVGLRWALFALFWLAWLLMLIMAVVIIIQTPRCEPAPELQWIQESPMLEIASLSIDNAENVEDLLKKVEELEITSVYFPNLIDKSDFSMLSQVYDDKKFSKFMEVLVNKNMKGVTDFIADEVVINHPWYDHENYTISGGNPGELNYNNTDLLQELKTIFSGWLDKDISGFIMEDADTPGKIGARDALNIYLNEANNGAVVSGVVDLENVLPTFGEANEFETFLQQHVLQQHWNYFKYRPAVAQSSGSIDNNVIPMITMAMFLVPGTPILDTLGIDGLHNHTVIINTLNKRYRTEDAIKFGKIEILNGTQSSGFTVGFSRLHKGVPGYVVAVNLHNAVEMLDFSSLSNMNNKGTIEYCFPECQTGFQEELSNVTLSPYQGKILQFVPIY